jgi:chemotaxis protein MotB
VPRKQEEQQEGAGILILYTSLMILLLAFFILLNSLSKIEEAKVEAVFQSLMGTFGFLPGGGSPFQPGKGDLTSVISAPINPVDQDYMSLRGLVRTLGLSGQVRLLRSQSIKTVVLPDVLLFEPDSYELTPQARNFLTQVAQIIKDRAYPVSIYGHTDDAPPQRPGVADNWDVSARRALAVLRYLVSQGVDPRRLAAFGLAGNRPLVPNDSPVHRRQNNRVELVFDARDPSIYQIPDSGVPRKLNFRGFTFDLFGEEGSKGKPQPPSRKQEGP